MQQITEKTPAKKTRRFASGRRYLLRISFIILFDLIIAMGVPLFSLLVAYDFDKVLISAAQRDMLYLATPFFAVLAVAIYYIAHLYSVIWTYVSFDILYRVFAADTLLLLIQFIYLKVSGVSFPLRFWLIEIMLIIFLTTLNRFFYRFVVSLVKFLGVFRNRDSLQRALLVGAGEAGNILIRESKRSSDMGIKFVAAVDDNPGKNQRYLEGVRVMGNRNDVPALVRKLKIDVIVLAIPTASPQNRREVLEICKQTKKKILIMPSVSSMVMSDGRKQEHSLGERLRDIRMEDLLGRDPIEVNNMELSEYISGQRVLITGAGGSIGSELARQIASFGPQQLILLDIYENGVYDVQMELQRAYPQLNMPVLIASVRDAHRMETIFASYKPQLVFHAAAHKHVPLMEFSPNEVVKNNVRGTYLCARMAAKYECERFVLISTDKAVNPTNIMGASKRLCEMIIQDINLKCDTTDFVAVRFGNVLGSNGSVIPLFRKQIEQGGPVTVTHPDIIRFFMTIPEAVNLVLQAGAYARGGEIFILDMGEPVKILDLARNMIYMAGYEPGKEIEIIFTGLRPGEKLYEEILVAEEGLTKTPNNKIFIGKPIEFDHESFDRSIEDLMALAWKDGDGNKMRAAIRRLVPTYNYKGPVMPHVEITPDPEQSMVEAGHAG